MVTKNSSDGMIFLLYDKCGTTDSGRHNYIILSTNDQNERLGLVQCMSITSMRDKEITMEVPILLSNDMVSYIVPYNIHSYTSEELELKNFKGCITDVEYISKYEFMQLLIDIYADSLELNLVSHEDVVTRYETYCNNFWKAHESRTEFREYESHIKSINERIDSCTNESVHGHKEELDINEPKFSKQRRYEVLKNKDKIKQQKISNKINRTKEESKRRKQETREKQEFQKLVKEYTHISVTDVVNEIQDTCDICNGEQTSTNNKFFIPYKNEEIDNTNIELTDLSILNATPRASKDFSDEEITLFLKGYEKYKYDELKTVIPDKWNSPGAFKSFYNSVKKEALTRRLITLTISGYFPDNKFEKSCVEWSDTEIKQYLSISTNHKRDPEFMLRFTGYDNINEVSQRTYQVKKEALTRNITV